MNELMTKNPSICEPTTGLEEIARQMSVGDCGCIPVLEGLRLVGILTDRDIVLRTVAAGKCPLELTARDVMSHPVATIQEDDTVHEAFRILQMNQIKRLPVMDSNQRLVGIVSEANLAAFSQPAELGSFIQSITRKFDIEDKI